MRAASRRLPSIARTAALALTVLGTLAALAPPAATATEAQGGRWQDTTGDAVDGGRRGGRW